MPVKNPYSYGSRNNSKAYSSFTHRIPRFEYRSAPFALTQELEDSKCVPEYPHDRRAIIPEEEDNGIIEFESNEDASFDVSFVEGELIDLCLECLEGGEFSGDITIVDQYGALGFASINGAEFCWQICQAEDPAKGPESEGDPDEGNFTFDWIFLKNEDTGEFQYGRQGQSLVSASDYFASSVEADHVSMCFESTGRPVFAVSHDGQFTVKREVGEVITTYGPFTGISAQMWYNGTALDHLIDSANRDAVCYYLKPAESKLFARFQRDNFGTEYTIIESLPTNFAELRFAEMNTETGIMTLKLIPREDDESPFVGHGYQIESAIYPLPNEEEASFDVTFVEGSIEQVISPTTEDEDSSFDVTFVEGFYFSPIEDLEVDDDASFDVTFVEGFYFSPIEELEPDEDPSFDVVFVEGEYELVIVGSGETDEDPSFDVSFVEGEYAAV